MTEQNHDVALWALAFCIAISKSLLMLAPTRARLSSSSFDSAASSVRCFPERSSRTACSRRPTASGSSSSSLSSERSSTPVPPDLVLHRAVAEVGLDQDKQVALRRGQLLKPQLHPVVEDAIGMILLRASNFGR